MLNFNFAEIKVCFRRGNVRPRYLSLSRESFSRKTEELHKRLKSCGLCGNRCGVNRIEGVKGRCGAGVNMKVSSVQAHFGEETPLVGRSGSGTIFLSNCPMKCVYCQNWRISQKGVGTEKTEEEVAELMLDLQERGCHNVNWVTPTHYVPQLVKSLRIAKEGGFETPVVYNTGGYDDPEVIELLDGIVDIYMPDVKYGSDKKGEKYSNVGNYWDVVRKNLKEMHNQVGDLKVDGEGIARRGLLVRHLVLPNGIAGTEKVLRFIARDISQDSYVNIMDQYYPRYRAEEYDGLRRKVKRKEVEDAKQRARELGLHRGFQ